jgi:hypothetical protein
VKSQMIRKSFGKLVRFIFLNLGVLLSVVGPVHCEDQQLVEDVPQKCSYTANDLSKEAAGKGQSPEKIKFSDVNALFRSNYDRARKEILAGLGPIIFCSGNSLTLMDKGVRGESEVFIRDVYTELKEISHITLGTYVILINHTDRKLPEDVSTRLGDFRDKISAASKNLIPNGIPARLIDRQKRIIELTLNFIDGVIAKQSVSRDELREYARSVGGIDMENAYDAASSQLATIDGIVNKWSKRFSKEEWSRLYVVIETGHMPRERQASLQYFNKLLKQKREGLRIITTETIVSDEKAIDLLLNHILDREVAIDFFKDEWRMHRDLLSDGAEKYLKASKGQRPEK